MSSLENFRSRFINVENTIELFNVVEDILPFKSDRFKIINAVGSIKAFKASIDCQIDSEDTFAQEYQEKNNETIRKRTPKYPKKTQYEKCVYYRCHHNTRYQATMSGKEKLQKNPSKRYIKNVFYGIFCLNFSTLKWSL